MSRVSADHVYYSMCTVSTTLISMMLLMMIMITILSSVNGAIAGQTAVPFRNSTLLTLWSDISTSDSKLLDLLKESPALSSVKAAAGPDGSSDIGDGSNLIAFSDQVENLKALYNQARKYLNADDAVLLGGYIVKLDKLGIQFLQAFPVAETALYTATVSLSSKVINVVVRSMRVAKQSLEIPYRTLALQVAIENARARGLYTTPISPLGIIRDARTRGRSALSTPNRRSAKEADKVGDMTETVVASVEAATSEEDMEGYLAHTVGSEPLDYLGLATPQDTVMTTLSQYLSSEFVDGPLTLCFDLLSATSDALATLMNKLSS